MKRPRRLIQTWHGGPGVSLSSLFGSAIFLRKGYCSFFMEAVCLALKS